MELLTASEDEAATLSKAGKPLAPSLLSSSSSDLSKSSNIYGSLPRFANARHLPTLPETGPLVRSVSLKDNSAGASSDGAPPKPPPSSSTNKPSPAVPVAPNQSHLSKSPQAVLRRVNSAGGAPKTPLITDLMKPLTTTSSTPSSTTTTTSFSKTTNNNDVGDDGSSSSVFKVPPTPLPPKTLDLRYVSRSV